MGNMCVRKLKNQPLIKRKLSDTTPQEKMEQIDMLVNCNIINRILQNRFLTLNWKEFCIDYMVDEKYGVSFDWEAHPLPEYYDLWVQVVKDLPNLNENLKTREVVKQLPMMEVQSIENEHLQVKAMSQLLMISNSYLFNELENVPQVLPKNIAVPIYVLSMKLGTKASLGWAQNLCNWELKDKSVNHEDLNNLKLRFSFTGKDDEEIFYLLSTLADFKMVKVIKSVFEVNQVLVTFYQHNLYQKSSSYFLKYFMEGRQRQFVPPSSVEQMLQMEEESLKQIKLIKQLLQSNEEAIQPLVIQSLNKMAQTMDEITFNLKIMFERNSPDFFFKVIRCYLQGYLNKDIFPNGLLFDGIEISFACEGGSGGNSPSFQIYERALGIQFDGELEEVQRAMRQGMLQKHLALIRFFGQYSFLRSYALLTSKNLIKEAYNRAIESYIQFNAKHLYYIEHYIERQIMKQNPGIDITTVRGTGNVYLKTVKQRYMKFQAFLIRID